MLQIGQNNQFTETNPESFNLSGWTLEERD